MASVMESLESTISDVETLLDQLQGSKLDSRTAELDLDGPIPDDEGDAYGTFADFKEAIMALLFVDFDRKLELQFENRIKSRGNITVKQAFMAFLGLKELSSDRDWQVPFEKNPKVLKHLKDIYAKEGAKLTPFSLATYAKVISNDLWYSLVLGGSDTVLESEVISDSQVNSTDRVMSKDLANAVSKKPPGRLLKAIDAYQERMIEEQPEGFNTFLALHWRPIVAQLGNMDQDKTTHAHRSRSSRKQYMKDAYALLEAFIASGKYFTHREFLSKEKLLIEGNPDNLKPVHTARRENTSSGNISSSTGMVFNPGYENEPVDVSKLIKEFNSLDVPFVSATPVPEEFWGDETWLQKNVLSQVRPSENGYRAVLAQIAQYLKADDQAVILITGRSDYGDLEETGDHARAIALARAEYMKAELVEMGVRASQIQTVGVYDTSGQIGIEISLKGN